MSFAPDFGLHFQKTIGKNAILNWVEFEIDRIDRIGQEQFTFNRNVSEGETYAATFDFGLAQMQQLILAAPPPVNKLLRQLTEGNFQNPQAVDLREYPLHIGIRAHLGELIRLEKEEFIPFVVDEFNAPPVISYPNLKELPVAITHVVMDGEELAALGIEYMLEEEGYELTEGYTPLYVCRPQMYDQCEWGEILLCRSIDDARKNMNWQIYGSVQYAMKLEDLNNEQYFNARVFYTSWSNEFKSGFGERGISI